MVEETGGLRKDQLTRWDYKTHFGEYLRLLGRKGDEGLESMDKFPARIELDNNWHTILDNLRAATKKDGVEWYASIGFQPNSRELYFPKVPAKGEPNRIPRAVKADMNWNAWEKHGVTSILGSIHTHPGGSPFSTDDLFGFLNRLTTPKPFIKGLANEKENIFAFRTRETFMVSERDTTSTWFSEVFKKHWANQAGYKFSEDHSQVTQTEPLADWWKANIGIAEAHRMTLYKGKPREDLVRVYP